MFVVNQINGRCCSLLCDNRNPCWMFQRKVSAFPNMGLVLHALCHETWGSKSFVNIYPSMCKYKWLSSFLQLYKEWAKTLFREPNYNLAVMAMALCKTGVLFCIMAGRPVSLTSAEIHVLLPFKQDNPYPHFQYLPYLCIPITYCQSD